MSAVSNVQTPDFQTPDFQTPDELRGWDRFWFLPESVAGTSLTRRLLCGVTAIYFIGAWGDAAFWYSDRGPFSAIRMATFLRSSGLEDAATWMISPLFLASSPWLYQLYLAIGIAVAFLVAIGRGGRFAPWALWLLLVGWANRAMMLSGLTETVLSLGLFASAIAPPASTFRRSSDSERGEKSWLAGFSRKLMATQITIVLIATFVTMLAGRVWFNGVGAYALAAPAMDRTIDWTNSPLTQPTIHEALTHFLVLALPLGLFLAWIGQTNRLGKAILMLWCAVIALLGSVWLYSMVIATMVLAIGPDLEEPGPSPKQDRSQPIRQR